MNETSKKDTREMWWMDEKAYERVNEEIDHWPVWKKKAYNEMFVTSCNAKPIAIE